MFNNQIPGGKNYITHNSAKNLHQSENRNKTTLCYRSTENKNLSISSQTLSQYFITHLHFDCLSQCFMGL